MASAFHFVPGSSPLLVSIPHAGTAIPDDLAARMTDAARDVPDTDWHLEKLYDFAADLGAGVIAGAWSRYVIDLNRDPDGKPLYPGADETELCPTRLFDQRPIYQPGQAPDGAEIAQRRQRWWQPYHDQLRLELDRLVAQHGRAILFEAHSIRSVVPRLFDGRLADFNLGTAGGASLDPAVAADLLAICQTQPGRSSVLNGRFKGGYITRAYGRAGGPVQTVQLEMTQCCYMDEDPPFTYRPDLAVQVQPMLRRLLQRLLD